MGGYLDDVNSVVDAGSVASCALQSPPPCATSISTTNHQNSVNRGQTVTYQIDVLGALPGTTVSNTFTPPLEAVSWCTGASCTNFVEQPFSATLPAGGNATYLVRGRVGAAATGELVSLACVAGDSCSQTCKYDKDPIQAGGPVLRVTKDDGLTQVAPGQTITYTITVKNVGGGAATGVVVTDSFPAKLVNVSWCPPEAGPGCPNPVQGNVNQTISLAPGDTAIFTVTGTVGANATGTLLNEACAQIPAGNRTCANDSDLISPSTADVEITKSVLSTQPLIYRLTVTNHGPARATHVIVTDPTSGGLLPAPAFTPPAPPVACAIVSSQFRCVLPDLDSGQSLSFNLEFQVTDACALQVVNEGAVSADQTDPVPSNNMSKVPATLPRTAHLMVAKTGPAKVNPGDSIKYTVTVTNQGPDCAPEMVVTDPVPAELVNPVLPPACKLNGATVECTLRNLLPGTSAAQSFDLSFTVAPATCGGQITNTATVNSINVNPPESSSSTVITTVDPHTLTITKTDGLTTAMPGQGLLYTIVVSNPGACAVDGATVSDVCPTGLTKARWCRGAACTPSHLGNLLDTLSLPAGGSATYQFSGIVSESFDGTLTNVATVTTPAGTVSATDTTEIGFTGVKAFCHDLSGSPFVGGAMTYTFVLVNHGPAAQADNPGDEFTDTLPAGLTLTGASASSGTASTVGNTAKWNGSIPVGGSVIITITATINAGTVGLTLCNQATIAFDADGDGINESTGFSDDPGEPGTAAPCCFTVLPHFAVPTLSDAGLAALALLLAGVALLRLRRRDL